ncbi:ABC transporter permease subunit, partial [Streptomyces sp. GSL17-113]
LFRIELPLAVPLILAGLRTSLVLAVGTATLAFFVNGGGLGELIDAGYKLNRTAVLVVGAVLSVGVALLVDWLGAVLEKYF